jgi:hypothetical protein
MVPASVGTVGPARRRTGSVGLAEPAQRFLEALETGRPHGRSTRGPGQVARCDPREGAELVRRHHRRLGRNNQLLWAELHHRIERYVRIEAGAKEHA